LLLFLILVFWGKICSIITDSVSVHFVGHNIAVIADKMKLNDNFLTD